ncbi:hypothetical protein JOC36_000525 [Weissella uvarum]|uniref:hypothetical protein n=1 Tax=Weissella uvarum TaxID=1479233 RepID=UPI001961C0FB|nr:hypothetical protein [Weissella uvarum]MBM7616976.1 hypothetical protein [Weissella uvarum]MCM0595277.1 hypothetical protein [Weissella uvarum]
MRFLAKRGNKETPDKTPKLVPEVEIPGNTGNKETNPKTTEPGNRTTDGANGKLNHLKQIGEKSV